VDNTIRSSGGCSPAGPRPEDHAEAAASFAALVRVATGNEAYDYQRRIAIAGLPDVLRIPTGAGKTAAAVLGWLFRRRFHPDPEVRAATPHWLAMVLPMRVLVEQIIDVIRAWLAATGLVDEVGLHQVMGGEGRLESLWRTRPEQDAVFVGTLDMLLSRALNRGYGENRFAWPIDFGLFNAGVQWVFDEVQLMGPALPTSRQLEAFRCQMGTAAPCSSMWMSATVNEDALRTVDLPQVDAVVELAPADREGPLARRLGGRKVVHRVDAGSEGGVYVREVAAALLRAHRPGTLTIAVLNEVARAREVFAEIQKSAAADAVLLHSRFRPDDRWDQTRRALAEIDPNGDGRIVVSTQIVEAGVDISATTLFTEASPWPSVVQRAGRCNRDGESEAAQLLWAVAPRPGPYEAEDIDAAASSLTELEGQGVTPEEMGLRPVAVKDVIHPVIRRRDLVSLFDTSPDLSGNDVDVGRFIRDGDDLDVLVAWRLVPSSGPPADTESPTRRELCPVPISELRKALKAGRGRRAWRYDHLVEAWVACSDRDLRPGLVLLLASDDGGYEPATGWNPASRTVVTPVSDEEPSPVTAAEEATGADPGTWAPGRWISLRRHLDDVEAAVRDLTAGLATPGLSEEHLEAAAVAASLHDWGKIHQVFQMTLLAAARDEERQRVSSGGPWAKSPRKGPRHSRKHFRHELASALAIEAAHASVLDGVPEMDLVYYLVAAHHGRVRLAIRSLPGETVPSNGARVALGIWDGDVLAGFEAGGRRLPEVTLDLSVMELGEAPDGRRSWTRRALALRDRPDLGPFRLGFLEALLRLADWRASAEAEA
jgi:CRISPR-associated endonuclease/helicase Cas3